MVMMYDGDGGSHVGDGHTCLHALLMHVVGAPC